MRVVGPEPFFRRSVIRAVGTVSLALGLMTPAHAQTLEAGCPAAPQPPEYVERTVSELDTIKPHTERWRESLQWQRLLRELDRLRFDGLNPQNYLLSDLARITDQLSAGLPASACQAELATLALAWSLSDLSQGRLNPEELGLMWHREPRPTDAAQFAIDIHRDFYHHSGLRQAYQRARPDIAQYQQLRAAYRQQYRSLPESWPVVPEGATLRQGDSGPRVDALVARLAAQGYLAEALAGTPASRPSPFDQTVADAVEAFQQDHGLEADGLVGKDTLEAMNLPPGAWLARIRANLERLRWITPHVSDDMVLVDIAGARIQLLHNGTVAWQGNTQVGRPERKTPALTSAISHITVNPTWTIPPTVFYEDTLPAIRTDPDYLSRNRLTVLDRNGTPLDPEQVDWSRPGNLMLRQAAGSGNALGQVVIRFPNPFAVYLHDTPSRWLFDTPDRFYSSGCVRVENAVQLSDQLFLDASEGTRRQIANARASGQTRNISLPARVPLIMAYWTAEADTAGHVRYRPDTYQEDRLVIDLLDDIP